MAQAPLEHGFPFDLLSLFQDLLCAPKVDVGGRQVSKALVVAMVVVMFDKSPCAELGDRVERGGGSVADHAGWLNWRPRETT